MSFASTATVLDSLKARIEALTPPTQFGGDDVFRVTCSPEAYQSSGFRATLVYANAARRKSQSARTCSDWQTTISVDVGYNAVTTEATEQTVLQIALADAEAILADLYNWAATTDGIISIDPDEGAPQPDSNGELHMIRQIRVVYQRA